MSISQHPSSDWLAAYAAGSLSLSESLCVSTHLEHCSICRQNHARLNQLGGELLEDLTPAPTSNLSFDDLMNSIAESSAQSEPEKASAVSRNSSADNVPHCLRKFIPEGFQQLKWSRLSPSIHSAELCRDHFGSKVELLRIKPGGGAPTHTHLGDELTVILEGSFSDEGGVYRAGDFMHCDGRTKHTPVASLDRECICLVVSRAPLQFTGFFSRLFNPMLRRGYA